MRRTAITALTGIALLLAAGCADSSEPADTPTADTAETTAPEPEATTAPAPATSPAEADSGEASVQQWASRVAEGAGAVRENYATWDSEHNCLPGDTDFLCTSDMLTMSLSASTLATLLRAGTNVGAPGYIGDPPAEVADLVYDTKTAAEQAAETADAAWDACLDGGEECTGKSMAMSVSYGRLLSQLDAWQPYGVAAGR